MDARARTQAVKAAARALRFDAVGIASADPLDEAGHLKAWIAGGLHAGMSYMSEDPAKRADPKLLLPGARSLVAVLASYAAPSPEPEPAEGRIARYARGKDYHNVVKKRVRSLRRRLLEIEPGAKVHPAVDTSPILERAVAAKAGVAWIGKSTMAISPSIGTYTFIGVLVTTMELEPDAPLPDRCGTCTACLDACPTGAFTAPYVLDARRCITYWTIEHRASLEGAPELHGWLAGCDVCQEVCPWNKFTKPTAFPQLHPKPELARPDLARFADPNEAAWRAETIRGTALHRTGEAHLFRVARRLLGLSEPAEDAARPDDP